MSAGVSPLVNKIVNVVVCVGATIVIVGALFKIQHYPGNDIILPIGLLTEAGIFMVYAFLPPPDAGHAPEPVKAKGNPSTKSLETMLSDAQITPESISKLSSGFQKLGTTVEKMTDLGDVVKSTGDFSAKSKEAAAALSNVSAAVNQATTSLAGFQGAGDTAKEFNSKMQTLSKNLSSLNTVYETELNSGSSHLKSLNQFYGKLAQISASMQTGAEDAIKAKDQLAALANNLGKLNQVYGSMLTAMQGR